MERIIKLTILVFLVLGICLGSDNGGDLEYLGSKKLLSKNPFKNDTVLKKFEEEIKRIKQEGSYQELLEKVKEMEQYIKTKYPEIQCRKSEYKWKKGGIGEIIIDGEEATDSNTSAKSLRWSGDKVIAGSGRMERAVSIARDSNGRLYAAFEEFHTTYNHYIIRIRVSSDNGDTWSNWYYIYSEDYDLLYPDIEVGEGWCDRLILSFYASDIKLLNLWTFDLDNPSNNCSWCIEARDPLGAGENIRPRIAMDYCDQWYVYIVWIEEDVSSGDDVYYSRLMFPCDCNATPSDPICIGEGVVNNVDISWGNYRLWVVYQVGWPGPVYLVKFNTMFGSPTGGYTSELLFSAYCLWPRIALSNHDNKACVLYTRAVDGDENNTNLGFARTEDSGENWEFRWFNDPNTNARLGDIYYMPYSSDGNNFHVAYWEDGYIKYMNTDDLYYWYNCSTVSDNSSNSDEDYVSVLANRENEGMVAWVYRYSSTDYDIHFDNNFAYPDLKVVDIWTNPSSPKEGESCYLYAKVKNIGDEVSPETKVKWYFEGEEISYDWVSSLNPGEEETYFDSYTFQVCGNGAFEACIESVGGEVNTDNNCRSEDLTVICTHPDLAVVDISVSPPSPKEGESCTICAKVKNIGDKISPSTKVKWYVNGASIGERDVPSLDPGQEETVCKTYTFSSCGNFTIKVCVESVSDEVNTDNNCRSEDLTVICTHPDL
ncbi:MAG: hypothetical protein H0Z30_07005, partial [Candidatus Marinimicrobia bacterium]|nr:hypothetical protein [Candidatus Neomarinimicrobiota bacterium]